MRLYDQTRDNPLDNVILLLTHNEARELRGKLDGLIQNREKAWHEHISDNEYQHEVTVALYGEVDISEFNGRMRQLIINDK